MNTNLFTTLMATMFNQKNVTTNNLAFLTGLIASAGLITYGILSIFMPGILAVLIMFATTAFFGYRTVSSSEEMPTTQRQTTKSTKSTY